MSASVSEALGALGGAKTPPETAPAFVLPASPVAQPSGVTLTPEQTIRLTRALTRQGKSQDRAISEVVEERTALLTSDQATATIVGLQEEYPALVKTAATMATVDRAKGFGAAIDQPVPEDGLIENARAFKVTGVSLGLKAKDLAESMRNELRREGVNSPTKGEINRRVRAYAAKALIDADPSGYADLLRAADAAEEALYKRARRISGDESGRTIALTVIQSGAFAKGHEPDANWRRRLMAVQAAE